MTSFLKEFIDLQISLVLQEKLRNRFDLNKFKAMGTQKDRFAYANGLLDQLGCGINKCAFILSSGKILKMASGYGDLHPSELEQNQTEVENSYTLGQDVVPKVFEHSEDYSWYIVEPVRTFKNKHEMKQVTNISDQQLVRFGILLRRGLANEMTPEEIWTQVSKTWTTDIPVSWAELPERGRELLEKADKLFGHGVDDIFRADHWGWGIDGRLLCVDTGIVNYGSLS